MGNCDSTEYHKRNNKIDQQLENDKKRNESTVKLLLLGAGEGGKSTILKQMRHNTSKSKTLTLSMIWIIHNSGFSADEARNARSVVCANLTHSMGALFDGLNKLQICLEKVENQVHAQYISKIISQKQEFHEMPQDLYQALNSLWNDAGIRAAFARRNEFYLNDSAEYFFDSLDRIRASDYVPTEQDILRTRVSTMGIIEVEFNMKNKLFRVFDVGGQRSQRKKWIHCFDDVHSIIYVSSLSEYNQTLNEDDSTNRMTESIQLFKQVINNKFFSNTNIILFLNKKDLFREKISNEVPLSIAFPSYTGTNCFEKASEYIQKKFEDGNLNNERSIYAHHTCATDTEQVQFVLDSVLDTILSTKLKGCGLF